MTENNSFISFKNDKPGKVFDQSTHKDYPLIYFNVVNGEGLGAVDSNSSYYLFCYSGEVEIKRATAKVPFSLSEGMYASVSGQWSVGKDKQGKAVVIQVFHTRGLYPETKYKAMDTLGGPIEREGRLKYIDGCTDSLLISPVKMGDPCLNLLHFPEGIDQTAHTHPSHRIGVVAKGRGECVTPFGNLPLTEGMIFVIKEWDGKTYGIGLDGKEHPIGTHKFKTTDSSMDVVAFHPDSDFGATDIDHPMINRTIVEGVSANQIDAIRTK